jgi:hypothetical protein
MAGERMNASATDAGGAAATSCGYQGYEFGAGTYPDSVCIEGRLHDADACDAAGNIYLQDEDIPCPMCRPLAAIRWWTEYNQMDGAKRRARANAISLVTDIRRNRGVETDLKALRLATGGHR